MTAGNRGSSKVGKALEIFQIAAERRALGELPEYVLYHTPFRRRWADLRGNRFHRSAIAWFAESAEIHTRLVFLLPRLKLDYPSLRSIDMEFEFYSENGRQLAALRRENVPLDAPLALESRSLPAGLKVPAPFSGSLWVKERLHLDEEAIFRRDGLFGSTHTYLDYYRDGDFIATLHDYCAYLPDQGLQTASLGMIPAYADAEKETFLLFHAAKNGIGAKDLEVVLVNAEGKRRSAPLGRLAPYSMRRVLLSELFGDAEKFLDGKTGQVMIRGLFRCLLRRTAYGVQEKPLGAFSLDHCYYSVLEKPSFYPGTERERIPKGWFNPFFVIQDGDYSTSAILFHAAEDKNSKTYDLLVYDAAGKLALRRSSALAVSGDAVRRIDFGPLLAEEGIAAPFVGHAEILYHAEPGKAYYERDLDIGVEYRARGHFAHIIFGADVWNSPRAVTNRNYKSACRVVCDERHTTLLAISNCSFDYKYSLEVPFTLSLVGGDRVLASKTFSLGPNATFFKSIEEIFPDAPKLLAPFGGIGYTTTTDINASSLTHLFFTRDRKSGALSVEHSLDV